jgi:predicted amidohydrolase YtcJ
VGQLADLVVLDAKLHKVRVGGLADLKVTETIKEGKSISSAT